jgi:hypothetical protein
VYPHPATAVSVVLSACQTVRLEQDIHRFAAEEQDESWRRREWQVALAGSRFRQNSADPK